MCEKNNPCRGLIVEDDMKMIGLFIRNVTSDFNEFALDLTIAQSLAEARHIIKNAPKPFDVISLDLGLPDSKGPATFDAIHTLAQGIPIFVYTAGHLGENFHDVVVAHGAERYLLKTDWNVDKYLTLLHYAAGRHRARLRDKMKSEFYQKLSEKQAQELNEIRNKITPESEGAKALDDFIANMKHAVAS
jgi:response regulator of citrate/malate metabolism